MNSIKLPAIIPSSVGAQVYRSLAACSEIHVSGITSRGIFLTLAPRMIAFISRDGFKGPLTVNLPLNPTFFESITSDVRVDYQSDYENNEVAHRLIFERSALEIHFDTSQRWTTPECSENINILATRNYRAYLEAIHTHLDLKNELLETVVQFFDPDIAEQTGPSQFSREMHLLVDAILSSDNAAIHEPASFFSGRGRGLTPSGDDFLLGLIYTLQCLEKIHCLDLSFVNRIILPLVEQRSTTISANLIQCAARKEIDERLYIPFDRMKKGLPFNDSSIKYILDWGSSSGVDTLSGITLGFWMISTCQQRSA